MFLFVTTLDVFDIIDPSSMFMQYVCHITSWCVELVIVSSPVSDSEFLFCSAVPCLCQTEYSLQFTSFVLKTVACSTSIFSGTVLEFPCMFIIKPPMLDFKCEASFHWRWSRRRSHKLDGISRKNQNVPFSSDSAYDSNAYDPVKTR